MRGFVEIVEAIWSAFVAVFDVLGQHADSILPSPVFDFLRVGLGLSPAAIGFGIFVLLLGLIEVIRRMLRRARRRRDRD